MILILQSNKVAEKVKTTHMHGGGPSPSGSSFRHSYGFAAVSNAHTSANGRFPNKRKCQITFLQKQEHRKEGKVFKKTNRHFRQLP